MSCRKELISYILLFFKDAYRLSPADGKNPRPMGGGGVGNIGASDLTGKVIIDE